MLQGLLSLFPQLRCSCGAGTMLHKVLMMHLAGHNHNTEEAGATDMRTFPRDS